MPRSELRRKRETDFSILSEKTRKYNCASYQIHQKNPFPFISVLGDHRSHRMKGSFSLALVIEISKIPKICGFIFRVPISLIFNAFWEIYQYIENFFLEFCVNMYMVGQNEGKAIENENVNSMYMLP